MVTGSVDLFDPLATNPGASAVITDFDGTLAPIVADPLRAAVEPAARRALARLVGAVAVTAIVSGRTARDVAERVGVPGVVYVGCYGLETLVDGVHATDPRAEPYAGAIVASGEAAARELPGLWIERKGDLAVALHWRRSPERADEVLEVARELAVAHGLTLVRGKLVAELHVPVPVDKGTAVESIIGEVRAACFAGDDRGDLAAFGALARARDRGDLDAAVCIAVRSEEEPAELAAMADVSVDGPAELGSMLGDLAARVARR